MVEITAVEKNQELQEMSWRGVEKREPSCTVAGNVNWYNHYGKKYENTSENKELPYNPAIPLLGMYS